MARSKRRITAEDLYRMQIVFDPQISPDGRQVIFRVQRVDRKKEKKYSNLWIVPAAGGRARQFTFGDQNDSQPSWSPDGRQVAFISDRGDKNDSQIYLISLDGGEARPLTEMKGAFSSFEWSPDGKQIVCSFRKKDPEVMAWEKDERKKELGIVSRRITRADYKMDGEGYFPKEKWHIWTIDVSTGKSRQLTAGEEYQEQAPRWSPDGQHILFLSNRSERPDITYHLTDLFLIPAGGGELRRIETPPGPKMLPSFSPDGSWVAYLGREGKGNAWKNSSVWVVPADGGGPANNLTGRYDVHVASGTLTDTGARQPSAPVWSPEGQRLYFHVTRHGSVDLCSVTLLGDELQTIVTDGVVGDFGFDRSGQLLAYFHGGMGDLGQVWSYNMATGRRRQLTHFNTPWLRNVDLGQTEEVWFKGRDGNDLQGWILKPPGFEETRKYPSILEIHGGPLAQYGNTFMQEFYFLAAQGYVVYFANPRGGQGYGEAHSKAIYRRWGEADYSDLMAFADLLAAKPYIDPDRMGVTGGSYGGYMTTWIVGHTDRFKAAVGQRVVSNLISFWGSSDIGFYFEDAWGSKGEPPWKDLEKYWDQSPMKFVENVQTPTMIIHSEQDLRCRLEQGEQFFLALRQRGVETELVIFPDSSHGLSRIGRTDRRIERLNHILRWMDMYLKS